MTSYFDVLITRDHAPDQTTDLGTLSFRTNSVSLPGRRNIVEETKYYGMPFAVPFGSAFNDLDMTIYLSEDWREKLFLEKWFDDMLGKYRSLENHGTAPNMFDIGYAHDIWGTVSITCYTATGAVAYKVQCIEAMPTFISDVSMDWNDSNIAQLKVGFNFRYYNNQLTNSHSTESDPH